MARGETIMPIPGGEITTSEIWVTPEVKKEPQVEEVTEEAKEEE